MRMRTGMLGLLVCCATLAQAQQCDSVISDQAGVLGGQAADVDKAAQRLIAQGADPRVVTVPGQVQNIDSVESSMEEACPSWQAPDGSRKSTLLVLMVAPQARKFGLYYGPAWRRALENRWNGIKRGSMAPRFRNHDWAGGFIAAEDQLTSVLAAASQAPARSATRASAPSSPSSSSNPFIWIAALLFLGACLAYAILSSRGKKKEAGAGARQAAVFAKNNASGLMLKANDAYKIYEATSDNKASVQRARSLLDQASQEFTTLAGSSSGDPEQPGLSATQLRTLALQYERIGKVLNMACTEIATGGHVDTLESSTSGAPAQQPVQGYPAPGMDGRNYPLSPGYVPTPVYSSVPFFQPPIVIQEPVIIDRSREYYNEERAGRSQDQSFASSDKDEGGGGSGSWDSGGGDDGGSSDSGGGSSDF